MKSLKIFAIIILLFTSKSLYSQGMNNDYPIDSIDTKIIFEMMGFDIFKFPLIKQSEPCKFIIKRYDYNNHKLTDSSIVSQGLPEDCLYLYKKEVLVRCFVQSIDSNTFKFSFNFNGATLSQNTQFGDYNISMSQSRAYSDFQPIAGKNVPFLIFYAYDKKNPKNSISCPGDAPLEKVAERYDIVVAFTFELIPIKI